MYEISNLHTNAGAKTISLLETLYLTYWYYSGEVSDYLTGL